MTALLLAGGRLPGSAAPVDVLVRDGVIASVGPAGSADAAGVETRALDGRFVIPGLWDHHVHFTQWTKVSRRLDLSRVASAAEAVALVRDALAARDAASSGAVTGAGHAPEALVGYGFRDGLWPDLPTKDLLDAVAGDTPVLLVSGDLHCCWASSAALAPHGYGDHPTGLLREDDCFDFMYRVEEGDASALDARAVEVARDAARRGVVGVVDLEIDWNPARWRRLAALGHDALRVELGIWPQDLDRARDAGLRTGDLLEGTGGLVRVGPAKVVTDGSLNTRTAYCFDPYPDLDGQGGDAHGGACGTLSVPPEELRGLMLRAARQGLRPAIHAIGDHANRLALDAFAHLDRELRGAHRDAEGLAGSIEHAQLLTHEDVARFAALGVVASVQPEHAMDDRDVADVYWAGRTGRAFALADLRAAGTRLALGSDAPVAPLDPWATMSAAVGRARDGRAPWHPEQAIDRAAALDASVRTRVAAGERADLAVVDADPLADATTADDLRAMRVSATLLGGRFTHDTLGG
ncbi:amidohydrolase family protein [Clavibacter tessellarius]|uniref:Amidohydrolase n=1 Tax=Clavibacter tessellarius TaxID=31965 RepID=A0A225CI83_9MICO|nr:amidohydrolase family protein [Clavibacter michiganensis]OQJ63445.1 amidohydrolase [Clavibacter michiganensis subsp. tessellarius]UKF33580.1 amidohydrolase family protein [Clavibacter michiganensis subsp. tessellarius]